MSCHRAAVVRKLCWIIGIASLSLSLQLFLLAEPASAFNQTQQHQTQTQQNTTQQQQQQQTQTQQNQTQQNQTQQPLLLGSNSACHNDGDDNKRKRRDWDHLSLEEKDLYMEALETSMERGLYKRFIRYHADFTSGVQAHETCAFMLWHRRYILGIENMLRSLAPKFACLTLPYWNIMEDEAYGNVSDCDSYASCSFIVNQLGRRTDSDSVIRVYEGFEVEGTLFDGRPFDSARDDNGQSGIVRNDLFYEPMPTSTQYREVLDLIVTHKTYTSFTRAVQTSIHDDVHDTVGGLMPTLASPSDVLFLSWHSTMDLFHSVWHLCHAPEEFGTSDLFNVSSPLAFYQPGGAEVCNRTEQGGGLFPNLTISSEIHIKSKEINIRDDPLIGKYFQGVGMTFRDVANHRLLGEDFDFTYEMPERFQKLLTNSNLCPRSTFTYTDYPTMSPVVQSSSPTVTLETLDSVDVWKEQIQSRLQNAYPNAPDVVRSKTEYLNCLVEINEAPERMFSAQFVNDFIQDRVIVEECVVAQVTVAPSAPLLFTQTTPSPTTVVAQDTKPASSVSASARHGRFQASVFLFMVVVGVATFGLY